MINQAFLTHFKIPDDARILLEKEAQNGASIVGLAIEKKLIDEASYLKWAQNHYGLSLLKEGFLNDHDQVAALLTRYKNVFPKNTVPFYEWDGVIFVMCLEPVQFQAPQPMQYVLASYYTIMKYASLNESSVKPTLESVSPVETNEVTNPLFKNLQTEKQEKAPSFSFEVPEGFSQPAATNEMPAGLSLPNNKMEIPDGMDSKQTSILNLTELEKVAIGAPTEESPEGLSFPPTPKEKPAHVVEEKVTSEDLKKIKTAITGKEPQSPKAEEVLPPTILESSETTDQPTKLFDLQIPEPQAITKISVANGEPVITGFEDVFMQMKKYFSQSMIIGFKNNILSPIKWDATWIKDPNTQSAIDISNPSIFRIVCETSKPYHGYVIPNTINDTFFANWNQGKYPEHVTLYPVAVNKQLIGMILGTCSREATKQFQLHHIESLSSAVAEAITKEMSKAA